MANQNTHNTFRQTSINHTYTHSYTHAQSPPNPPNPPTPTQPATTRTPQTHHTDHSRHTIYIPWYHSADEWRVHLRLQWRTRLVESGMFKRIALFRKFYEKFVYCGQTLTTMSIVTSLGWACVENRSPWNLPTKSSTHNCYSNSEQYGQCSWFLKHLLVHIWIKPVQMHQKLNLYRLVEANVFYMNKLFK
jgi:hypothetical protein